MIDKLELRKYAQVWQLSLEVVQKDYVLGWLTAAIGNHPKLKTDWIFKGGTCLKKCYFETYRFSEDLDFTIPDASYIEEARLKEVFAEVATWVYSESGIQIPVDEIGIDIYENPRGVKSAQAKLPYVGPSARRGNLPKIKFDLTSDEVLVFEPVVNEIFHPYSDKGDIPFQIQCYSFLEIFAEKTRALAERARPRDLYDIAHLFRNKELVSDKKALNEALQAKCDFKNIPKPTFDTIENHPQKAELNSEWTNMLRHQLPELPALNNFWKTLEKFFAWLVFDEVEELAPLERKPEEELYSVPRITLEEANASFIRQIQYAASNRLLLELGYKGKLRTLEPYSFRRGKGKTLLYGFELESNHIKAFALDRIEQIQVTQNGYRPRYRVEIGLNKGVFAPPLRRRR